jgi:hypothetical protein
VPDANREWVAAGPAARQHEDAFAGQEAQFLKTLVPAATVLRVDDLMDHERRREGNLVECRDRLG